MPKKTKIDKLSDREEKEIISKIEMGQVILESRIKQSAQEGKLDIWHIVPIDLSEVKPGLGQIFLENDDLGKHPEEILGMFLTGEMNNFNNLPIH